MSKEAQSRRDRSEEVLRVEQVPINDCLPLIETVSETIRRSTEEVATRAMALCVVSLRASGEEQSVVDQLIEEYKVASAFTPKERKFMIDPEPDKDEFIQFSWRFECYWVMLWALGFVDKLARPEAICDVYLADSLLRDSGREGFLQKANMRSQVEIVDAADLIYRYHWAVVDAMINNRKIPAGLIRGVVLERHHALNWLIGYQGQEWDEISTDT